MLIPCYLLFAAIGDRKQGRLVPIAALCIALRRLGKRRGRLSPVSLDEIDTKIGELLETIQKDMYEKALKHREENTHVAKNWDEFLDIINNKQGFIKAMWCGSAACENEIKDELGGVTSRCMPFQQEKIADTCIWCGKPAKALVYWGKAY